MNVRLSLMLCDRNGRFLYEARPDVFPEGYLTVTEIDLWAIHLKEQNDRATRKG